METINIYTFAELPEDAKARALSTLADVNVDYDWWESAHDAIETAGRCLGIDCKVECFDLHHGTIDLRGSYSYRKGWRKALHAEFGGDLLARLERIGAALQDAQRRLFYRATAALERPYYSREGTAYSVDPGTDSGSAQIAAACDDIDQALRDFEHEALRLLRREYEYLTSEQAVIEAIEANDYRFDENGRLV